MVSGTPVEERGGCCFFRFSGGHNLQGHHFAALVGVSLVVGGDEVELCYRTVAGDGNEQTPWRAREMEGVAGCFVVCKRVSLDSHGSRRHPQFSTSCGRMYLPMNSKVSA